MNGLILYLEFMRKQYDTPLLAASPQVAELINNIDDWIRQVKAKDAEIARLQKELDEAKNEITSLKWFANPGQGGL